MRFLNMNLKSTLFSLILVFSLPLQADEDLCAPFKDAEIDTNLLSLMLQAAEDGELYRIRQDSSKMGFCVNSPLGMVEAYFKNFNGGLALKDIKQQGTAMVSIDVNSLETDSVIIETMLKGESFFDAENFPGILFISTGLEWIGSEKAILKGNLTMHGITRAIAFYVDMQKSKSAQGEDLITVMANTTIQRSAFGIFTLSPLVNDRVNLCMKVDAYRYRA